MKIELAGHHVEITEALQEAVHNKFKKIKTHYPDIDTLSVILTVERKEQKLEVNTSYMGSPVSACATNDDLYTAIANGAKKLDSALAHRKGSLNSRRNDKANFEHSEHSDDAE